MWGPEGSMFLGVFSEKKEKCLESPDIFFDPPSQTRAAKNFH
jgi:hypothetical protein